MIAIKKGLRRGSRRNESFGQRRRPLNDKKLKKKESNEEKVANKKIAANDKKHQMIKN